MLNQYQPQRVSIKKPHPDQKYIEALRSNDRHLIEEIYTKCSKLVKQMVMKNNGDMTDAKDLFQEILIGLYRQSNEGFILTCPLEQFVYMASKRKWINMLRQRKIKYMGDFQEIPIKDCSDDISEITDAFLNLEEKEKLVHEKFKFLGPSCKEILKLSWTKNQSDKYLSWKEIALELDLSYGYVRKKASECKERLMTLVKKDPTYQRLS